MFLDLSRKVNVTSVIFEHGRMGITEPSLISSCGNVKKINIWLQNFCNLHTVFQCVAAFKKFRTAHTELDGESRSHTFTDCLQNLHCKTTAVFKASAILIGTLVKIRRKELVDQPAMSAVDHDHLKTCSFCQGCCLFIGSHDLIDQLFCEDFYLHAIRTDSIRRAPLVHGFLSGFICHISSCIHSGMGKFNARDGTVTADGVCSISCGCQGIQDGCVQMIGMGAIGFRMYHTLADCYGTCTAFSSQFIKGCRFRADTSVVCNICSAHRSSKHTVSKCYTSNLDRFA